VADDLGGTPICPWCGETITVIDADGYGLCQVDRVRIWVPPALR
jgi:hypothetical protein